jgi:hypothetical protein
MSTSITIVLKKLNARSTPSRVLRHAFSIGDETIQLSYSITLTVINKLASGCHGIRGHIEIRRSLFTAILILFKDLLSLFPMELVIYGL